MATPTIRAKLVLEGPDGGAGSSLGKVASERGGGSGFSMKSMLGSVVKGFGKSMKNLGKVLLAPLLKMVGFLAGLAKVGAVILAGILGVATGYFGAMLLDKFIIQPFKEAWEKLITWWKETDFTGYIQEKWQDFKDWLHNTWVGRLWDYIQEKFQAFKTWIKESWIGRLWSWVAEKFQAFKDWIKDTWVGRLWGYVADKFHAFTEWIQGTWVGKFIKAVKGAFGWLLKFLGLKDDEPEPKPSTGTGSGFNDGGRDSSGSGIDYGAFGDVKIKDVPATTREVTKETNNLNNAFVTNFQLVRDLKYEVANFGNASDFMSQHQSIMRLSIMSTNVELMKQVALLNEARASAQKRSSNYASMTAPNERGTAVSDRYGNVTYSTRYGQTHPSRQIYNEDGSTSGYTSNTVNTVKYQNYLKDKYGDVVEAKR